MANQFTSSTLSGVYNDDFDPTKGFHQILFNSGRALQARELTQLQTMIYAELGRFGNNIFKEGAVVSGGGATINSNLDYIKISATNQGGAFEDIPIGTVFKNPLTNVEARVIDVRPLNQDAGFDLNTLYVQYTNAGSADVSSEATVFGDGETLYDQSGGGYEVVTEIPNAVGKATKFSIEEGDFFVLGHFVHVNSQSILLEPYNQNANAEVGFKVTQDVITVNDDQSLFDNANGIVNNASPGADRYRINLTLTTKDKIASDETFVFLANVENSKIVEELKDYDAYNKINDVLALRTREESGNYIVNPFTMNIEDAVAGDSSLELTLSSGLAYVNGYRVEKQTTTSLTIPRPQQTETIENDVVPVQYGNYFLATSNRGLPALDATTVSLYNSTGGSGAVLGTCRIRAVERAGSQLRVYVFDVKVDADKSLRNVRSIGTGTSDYFNIFAETEGAKIYGSTENDLLFPTSRPRPESFNDIILTKQVFEADVASSGSSATLATLPSGQSYTNTANWVISTANSAWRTSYNVNITNGGRDAEITGLPNGTYKVLSYVQKTATRKTKTLTSTTDTLTRIDSGDVSYYKFAQVDIFDIDSARENTSTGNNMINSLKLDDGQRDNYYANGRLIVDGADSAPENLYVNYRYFARGASGDFFTATSYTNLDAPYIDIPDHTLKDGTLVNLRNYFDFRPDETSFGTADEIFDLPQNGTNITSDISYYLPRADKLILTQEGDVQLLLGQQAGDPQFKATPDNALELYKVLFNANTLDETDLQVTPIEHKHYTMKDIAKLEAKLDQLEEFTTLSLLELEQRLTPALDSAGDERVESGSLVDDFQDQTGADTRNPDYAASLDPEARLIRPQHDENSIRLIIDNALSSNIVKKGDNVYIAHDSVPWATQDLASRFVKVNSVGYVDNIGTMKISPSSDETREVEQPATKAIPGSNRLDRQQAYLWNNWSWNWTGRNVDDHQAVDERLTTKRIGRRREIFKREKYGNNKYAPKGTFVQRPVPSETLRQTLSNRVVDVALIPWIRARKVYFHAKGLKPNTKFTPFFDGTNVQSWCREESQFIKFSDRTDDNGNKNTQFSLTGHPAGSTELISDENGEIIGSFFIPNTRPKYSILPIRKDAQIKEKGLRFRAGVREFSLLDINVNDWEAANSKAIAYYTVKGVLENRNGNILSTRKTQATTPYTLGRKTTNVFNSKELRNRLNEVDASDVGITEPKFSGLYGPQDAGISTAGLQVLDDQGKMASVLSDYIDVNQRIQGASEIRPTSRPQNPLAQTFYVDNQLGLTLTSVKLFFRKKDSGNLPVSIHIRPVIDGKPSESDIVPDSHVYLNPGDVNAIGLSPTLSVIQNGGTTFTFEEPVYLQPWTEYAIVVTSQSSEYELFSAKTQEAVYGSTVKYVTTQPAPGSIFLPQNGTSWIESKDQDLMFVINRAKFDLGGASLILKNAPLPAKMLKEEPLQSYQNTRKVYVHHPCHGLEPGDTAALDSCDALGNIASGFINGEHTVDSADIHGYTITLDAAAPLATSTVKGGGEQVLSRRNSVFNVANPYFENVIPNRTSIDVSAKFTEGKALSSTRITAGQRWVQDAEYQRITPKQNIEFNTPKAVYNNTAETDNLGAGVASTYFKLDLKTSNDYVSPIIDLQRSSLTMVGFCIDNPSVTPAINPVDESQPSGGTTGSKHITSPVTLEEDAVGIEIKGSVNVPDNAEIDVWYRTASPDEDIYQKPWVYQDPVATLPKDNDYTFRESKWLAGGTGGNLKPFNQSQAKVVMRGDGDKIPSLKNLRFKWLAV